MIFGGGVLLVGVALHIAWIAKRADARGRSVLGWVGLAVALAALGVKLGLALIAGSSDTASNAALFLVATSPITLGLAPLIAIALVLLVLPTRAKIGTTWPVYAKPDGAGTLVIADDAIELRWPGRTERIARPGLTVEADVETLRLRWRDGDTQRELALMPTGKPATRDGRVRQVEVLAARLTP